MVVRIADVGSGVDAAELTDSVVLDVLESVDVSEASDVDGASVPTDIHLRYFSAGLPNGIFAYQKNLNFCII
jgi:hypothetical protein